jgi:hypothetical protein
MQVLLIKNSIIFIAELKSREEERRIKNTNNKKIIQYSVLNYYL